MNAAGFYVDSFFSSYRIEYLGGGWERGVEREVGLGGKPKAETQTAWPCLQYVT